MKSYRRMLLLMLLDAAIVNVALAVPFILRFYEANELQQSLQSYFSLAPWITVAFIAIFYAFKLYKRSWAYASLGELFAILYAVSIGSMSTIVIFYFTHVQLPRSIALMHWALTILLMGGSRVAWRCFVEHQKTKGHKPGQRALIIGAGDAGVMLARELKNHNGSFLPVGFIDDDPEKKNMDIMGLPVLGARESIPEVVALRGVDLIVIAMPSVDAAVIREIVGICRSTPAELKILPGMYQIINGHVSINHLRPVQLEDLLHRPPVKVSMEEIAGYLGGETVLVTGAGGSIGSELCRQVAAVNPDKIILMDHSEYNIHSIWLELRDKFPDIPLAIEIADIRDRPRVHHVFQVHRPSVVFHAAAHKHVPLMELHPAEAVKTNIFGTYNLADAANLAGVKVFVMISTDKAVNPSSVMGATKRMAEMLIKQQNNTSKTIFTAVRFGNVLGSSGSVVPLFEQQIARGGPVTVTHPDMVRFFMTIPEAVQLVIQAGAMAGGGEVFVLDMGKPVRIEDMARDMIRLSGLEPDKDIEIKFTGIRPGEKLFEELLTAEEGSSATKHKRIYTARHTLIDVNALTRELANLNRKGLQCTAEDIFSALKAITPRFRVYRKEQAG
ncbi:polysaccharide biosynthesis protein [Pelotomaculum propionicicum]|uniref:polysaccharide biosynthesis protein n=1 Tax=Pelotomaculum propionicicum TaxID=258475 RepID=UPI003B773C83